MNSPSTPAAPPGTALGPEFNGFLYAPVGEDSNGMSLSVLSALARLDMDPWDMAGQLTVLPRDSSIPLLASLLERLPAGPADRIASMVVATRLVALLPSPHLAAGPARRSAAAARDARTVPFTLLAQIQLIAAFTLFALIGQYVLAGLSSQTAGEPHAASTASMPAAQGPGR